MADKMRRTAPINITFSERENPTATKLTALNTQSRAALAVIERAIGDIWHQGGDAGLDNYPLYLTNLSRFIGSSLKNCPPFNWQSPNMAAWPTSALSAGEFKFYDHIGERYTGQTRGRTLFKPKASSISIVTAGNLGTQVTDGLVDALGDFHISSDGEVVLFDTFAGTEVISYTVVTTTTPFTTESSNKRKFNVIPHPDQDSFTGCLIGYSGGDYILYVPPRRPITGHGYERWVSASEISDANNNASTVTGDRKLFLSSSGSIGTSTLPLVCYTLGDIFLALSDGDTVPKGYMYLYNTDTGTIIDDVVFTKRSVDSEVTIESATFDFSSYTSSTFAESDFSASPFLLIIPGSPLTDTIDVLISELYSSRSYISDTFMAHHSHADLKNLVPVPARMSDIHLSSAGVLDGDEHIHYLSRVPITQSNNSPRDVNRNAILTDLILGGVNSTDGKGTYINSPNLESVKIRFGGHGDAYPYAYTVSGVRDVTFNCTEPYSVIFTGPSDNAKELVEFYQTDDNEPFVKYNGTTAADQTKSISTVNGDGAVEGPKNFSSSAGWAFEGMIRVDINGTDYWMPYYSADLS